MAGNAEQRTIFAVNDSLDSQFGKSTEAEPLAPLKAGLIGLVVDHRERRLVIVLDQRVDGDAVLARVESQLAAKSADGATLAPLRIETSVGCNSSAELYAAFTATRDGTASVPQDLNRTGRIDPARGQVVLEIPDGARTQRTDAIATEFGDLVAVESGDTQARSGSRRRDRNPHYGGAGIRVTHRKIRPMMNNCTSFATVRRDGGRRRYDITAGHCVREEHSRPGDANGRFVRSAQYRYGRLADWHGGKYDMARIGGQSYSPHIWRNARGNRPSSRRVIGASSTDIGSMLCASGYKTQGICNIEVTSLNAYSCYKVDPDGARCRHNLIRAERPGSVVGKTGDSGAPVYRAYSRGRAGIRGMEIAGTAVDNLLAHRWSTIRRVLDVRIVTD